jgi:hypothetical protein
MKMKGTRPLTSQRTAEAELASLAKGRVPFIFFLARPARRNP